MVSEITHMIQPKWKFFNTSIICIDIIYSYDEYIMDHINSKEISEKYIYITEESEGDQCYFLYDTIPRIWFAVDHNVKIVISDLNDTFRKEKFNGNKRIWGK